jgi:quercetin dioxygenase-like cupin family protein
MSPVPFAVHRDDAPAYWSLGELLTVYATAQQTGGLFSLMEERLPQGAEPPPHVHRREDESFLILDGELTVRSGDRIFRARSGSFVYCPRDVPHLLTVESAGVRMLTCAPRGRRGALRRARHAGDRTDAAPGGHGTRRRPR